ncbi:MAG: hypothetical protein KatS3mg131_3201 [Candidatus Tectimicrobiota bacterium]|nr:MAG: hypothetical protein KatS3mg131_3201 [Candidatus Tectomicrobia bacterium]
MKSKDEMVLGTQRPLRLLHTADLHLDDAPQRPAALARLGLQAVVDTAIAEAVDLVLVAGDLFDHNRVADDTVAFVQEQLRRVQRPVVVLPGNHDCLVPNAIYDRYDFAATCPNVQVITAEEGQVCEIPGLPLVVWGRAMVEHAPWFHPLAALPARADRRWHVALAHGFFYPSRQTAERSSPIFAEEIRDSGWDYVALGHHHVLTEVSQGRVKAFYPGAPLTPWREASPWGSVLLVELSPSRGVQVRPHRLVPPAATATSQG